MKRAKFKKSNLTIMVDIGYEYEVDLEECRNSSDLVDWIFQLSGKKDITPEAIYEFLEEFERAFDMIFGASVQAERNKQWNWKKGIMI